jgi:hypothetical protein
VWFEEEVLFGDRELQNTVSKSNILARRSYVASVGNTKYYYCCPWKILLFSDV